jgi:hypothetical protein
MSSSLKKIGRQRFEVYVSHTRNPMVLGLVEEIAWYENYNRTLFGLIALDLTDKDFNVVILGRDENRKVRCCELQISFTSFDSAESWMKQKVDEMEQSGETTFPQGEEYREFDLFKPIKKNLDQYFKIVNEMPTHIAAKTLIQEITPHFFDIDGNFIEQFQTTGFNSRLWELYLFSYFNEEQLEIIKEYNAPDFMLSDGRFEVGLEAVIVSNRESNNINKMPNFEPEFIKDELIDKMPLRFGSSLKSKCDHTDKNGLHYWEYEHTKGKPFIIAIADFHEASSMVWSQPALYKYLYGYEYAYERDENGNLTIIPIKVESHMKGSTVIPSGFFMLKGNENISAILSTSLGTLSKFNRIGKQCGFDDNNTIMMRNVLYHDPDPNASNPRAVSYQVTEESYERWSEGVSIYHNPNALVPVPDDFFMNAANHYFKDGFVESIIPYDFAYNSYTWLLTRKDEISDK